MIQLRDSPLPAVRSEASRSMRAEFGGRRGRVFAALGVGDHQRERESVVALHPHGLDRSGAHPRLAASCFMKARTPWTLGSRLAASATSPSRTTLSTMMRLPRRARRSDQVK